MNIDGSVVYCLVKLHNYAHHLYNPNQAQFHAENFRFYELLFSPGEREPMLPS